MAWQRIAGDSARRYANTQTGEIISRRQYDKAYGRLAGVGISQDKIADYRKAAGIPKSARNLKITYGERFDQSGRRHVSVQTPLSHAGDVIARLIGIPKLGKEAGVSVRVKTKQGWRQSRVFHPTHHSDVGGAIGGAVMALYSEYGDDNDNEPDPDIELDWGYSG